MGLDYIEEEKKLFDYLSGRYHQKKQIILNSDFLPENISSNEVYLNYNDVELFWFIRIPISDEETYYYFGLKNNDNNIYLRFLSKVNKIESKSFFKFVNGELVIEVKFKEGRQDIASSLRKDFKIRASKDSDRNYIMLGKCYRYAIIKNLKNLMSCVEFDLDLDNDCLIINNYIKNKDELSFPKINQNTIFEADKIDSAIKVSKSIRRKSVPKSSVKSQSISKKPNVTKPQSVPKSSVKSQSISKKPIVSTHHSVPKSSVKSQSISKKPIVSKPQSISKSSVKSQPTPNIHEPLKKPVEIKNITFKDSNEALKVINDSFPFDTPKENQIETIAEIIDAINGGYKYIVLESGPGKSAIAATLINLYENSYILTANEKSKNRYMNDFNWKDNDEVLVYDYSETLNLNSLSKLNKRNLLIMDDAHRIDEKIIEFSSHNIDLEEYDKIEYNLENLEEKDYKYWLKIINSLSPQNDEVRKITDDIRKDPKNWICSHETRYGNNIVCQLLNVGNFLKESILNLGEICIFMSATILDIDRFKNELGLNHSEVKFIHKDLPFKSNENKIYAKNSFDMKDDYRYENRERLSEVINEILDNHKRQKGIIHAKSSLINFISGIVKNKRLLFHGENNFEIQIEKFNKSKDLVFVTDSIDESLEFPDYQCRFQIFLNQPVAAWGARPKRKDNLESHWYDYRTAVNLIQKLQRAVRTNDDFCTNYMLDEKFSMFIQNDISDNKIMPKNILNSIVDLDIVGHEMVSDNIHKKFGVYYLFDYIPTGKSWQKIRSRYDTETKRLTKRIHNYKDYDINNPNKYIIDFNYFTRELMKAIAEFSNDVLNDRISKIALFSVPSSTVKRDKSATIRESINIIEKYYKTGKLENDFGCKKEIINCGDLLTRIYDVNTSHDPEKRRPSYIEHKKSIKCCDNDILRRSDVAFLILDDITTRGTIMNACEDILIDNGAKKENIYKFAIAKTVGFYD